MFSFFRSFRRPKFTRVESLLLVANVLMVAAIGIVTIGALVLTPYAPNQTLYVKAASSWDG